MEDRDQVGDAVLALIFHRTTYSWLIAGSYFARRGL
jgi:hypothetical protein